MDALPVFTYRVSPVTLGWFRIQTLVRLVLICLFTTTTTGQTVELRNVAIGKPAVMDSLYEANNNVALPEHSVDGDSTSTGLWLYSCSHSGETQDFPKWWIVDLLREYDIREVWVTNRDSFEGRLRNFTIDAFREHPNDLPGFPGVFGQVCAFQPPDGTFPPKSATKPYTCNQPIKARYVRVVKYGYFALVMCEVQVFVPANQRQFYATRHPDVIANSPPFARLTDVRSYVHCASRCSLDDHCNAFSWKESALDCGLYKLSPYLSPSFSLNAEPGTDMTLNFEIGG